MCGRTSSALLHALLCGQVPRTRAAAQMLLVTPAVWGADVMHALWEADVVCYRADIESLDGDLQDRFWISDNRRARPPRMPHSESAIHQAAEARTCQI